jgi:CheY-like chemotaxis protein
MEILLLDSNKTTQNVMEDLLPDCSISIASGAAKALEIANENRPNIVILELSLAGHSGLEFLYEFRTYTDWIEIPVIVYTTVHLDDSVLKSRAWEQLRVQEYLYKPETSLATLKNMIVKHTSVAIT